MIVLDTNVLSEPLRITPNAAVVAWLDRQDVKALYLTAMSVAELWTGLELLPLGQKRAGLEAKIIAVLETFGAARILSFDAAAARGYAMIVARARRAGQVISVADGVIAATAYVRGFAVATRDAAPFAAAGVGVVNPWK